MSFFDQSLNGARLRRTAVAAFGEYHVRTAVENGAASSPWPGALVDVARAADPLTLMSAAWLITGPKALVAGPTAAFLHGCRAVAPTPVHLVVPYGSRRRSGRGIVIHNARFLDTDHEERCGLPVLGLERVLADLLCTLSPADALAVTDEVLARAEGQHRDALRARIRHRVRTRPDSRGTRIGTRILELATGRAESPAESWLLWRVVDSGFPVPEVNWWVYDLDGRPLYRLDLAWPSVRIVVEYDGHAAHVGREHRDEARAWDLRRRGWIVIRVNADDLRTTARIEGELHEAFAARGIDLGTRGAGLLRPRRHREHRAS